ncbi:MAG: ketol-acid reductoisomerase [Deltaproteobacteria bacterium]|nr:ketol-acid reductoisomerase [Deltaproteobacteria bacterium]
MATIYYDKDADLDLIKAKKVAVIGYGSQGHAHALNLRDSGVEVRVALNQGSRDWDRAIAADFTPLTAAEATRWADVVVVLAPDALQPAIYAEQIAPNLDDVDALIFCHGFNIRFGTIEPPPGVDIILVAPKAPGHRMRETFEEGAGVPMLIGVHQDASGGAKVLALSYACAVGGTRAGALWTTFAEETETDLFGEQAVLCGGISALVKAGFQTLVDAGYQPEVAYFECMHELKLIVDLMYRGGLSYMRYSVSDTAEHGDYTGGPRVITDATREQMRQLLAEIRDGTYAKKWLAENEAGRPWFEEQRSAEQEQPIEKVGAQLRSMMPFLDPVTVTPGGKG